MSVYISKWEYNCPIFISCVHFAHEIQYFNSRSNNVINSEIGAQNEWNLHGTRTLREHVARPKVDL